MLNYPLMRIVGNVRAIQTFEDTHLAALEPILVARAIQALLVNDLSAALMLLSRTYVEDLSTPCHVPNHLAREALALASKQDHGSLAWRLLLVVASGRIDRASVRLVGHMFPEKP